MASTALLGSNEMLVIDSSFDETTKRKAVFQMNEDRGFKMRSGQVNSSRKHSVAGPGGTSSQSAAASTKQGYTLYGGEHRKMMGLERDE